MKSVTQSLLSGVFITLLVMLSAASGPYSSHSKSQGAVILRPPAYSINDASLQIWGKHFDADILGALPNDDPSDLIFATFLGGIGADSVTAIAVDDLGFTYLAGSTTSPDFPTTPGAFDVGLNGGYDAFIVKLTPDGSALEYATFIGGAGDESVSAIEVVQTGEVLIAGKTASIDFPTTSGAFDTGYNGNGDAFVLRLNVNATDLVWSTFVGGVETDVAHGMSLDNQNNVYLSGDTTSSDFPTTPGAFDTDLGGRDAFAAKLSADGSLLAYATFLGGNDDDSAAAIRVDDGGNAFVAGRTRSIDFPTTPGAYDRSYNDFDPPLWYTGDAFVTKLNALGTELIYSTFVGGGLGDCEFACTMTTDQAGNVYLSGNTSSFDFPTTPGAFDETFNGGYVEGCCDAFVVKLNAEGSALAYGTFLGGADTEEGNGIKVNQMGQVFLTGNTGSVGFPTTSGAFDTTFNGQYPEGDRNAFLTALNENGSDLIYSTFMGIGYGWAVDANQTGYAFLAGRTYDPNFPTTPGAFDTTYNGGFNDAFVAKLNLNEPTAVGLVELVAGAADRAVKLPLGLLVAGALALAFFAVRYRRSRPPSISGATPPHNN